MVRPFPLRPRGPLAVRGLGLFVAGCGSADAWESGGWIGPMELPRRPDRPGGGTDPAADAGPGPAGAGARFLEGATLEGAGQDAHGERVRVTADGAVLRRLLEASVTVDAWTDTGVLRRLALDLPGLVGGAAPTGGSAHRTATDPA